MRYLIRLSNASRYSGDDCASLMERVRETLRNFRARAVNLRVSSLAIEFDLFADSRDEVEGAASRLEEIGRVITVRRLDESIRANRAKAEILDEAKRLFDEERFWEVHVTLEGLWRNEVGVERELLQGLILFAASYVHLQRARYSRTLPMLRRALRKIEASGLDRYGSFDLKMMKSKGRHFVKSGRLTPFKLSA